MADFFIAPNQAKARKWIKALRSGEFKQGTGLLRHLGDDTYCCLGVYPAVCVSGFYTIDGHYTLNDEGEDFLPTEVAHEVGVTYEGQKELSRMNDSLGFTFTQIADYLELKIIKRNVIDHVKHHTRRLLKK